jgi:ABC-type lipoprotein export system ATPase subunit
MIELIDVRKGYPLPGRRRCDVLSGVSLQVRRGEIVAIRGRSGAGKSTLLSIMGLLLRPTLGKVVIDGEPAESMTDRARSSIRCRRIGFVFQEHNLLPNLSVVENVMLPMKYAGVRRRTASRRAEELLDELGLAGFGNLSPRRLSGGERQRVGIARALANDHAYLFLDEPTGSLDDESAEGVLRTIGMLGERRDIGVVIVSHADAVAGLADRRFVLSDGELHGV